MKSILFILITYVFCDGSDLYNPFYDSDLIWDPNSWDTNGLSYSQIYDEQLLKCVKSIVTNSGEFKFIIKCDNKIETINNSLPEANISQSEKNTNISQNIFDQSDNPSLPEINIDLSENKLVNDKIKDANDKILVYIPDDSNNNLIIQNKDNSFDFNKKNDEKISNTSVFKINNDVITNIKDEIKINSTDISTESPEYFHNDNKLNQINEISISNEDENFQTKFEINLKNDTLYNNQIQNYQISHNEDPKINNILNLPDFKDINTFIIKNNNEKSTDGNIKINKQSLNNPDSNNFQISNIKYLHNNILPTLENNIQTEISNQSNNDLNKVIQNMNLQDNNISTNSDKSFNNDKTFLIENDKINNFNKDQESISNQNKYLDNNKDSQSSNSEKFKIIDSSNNNKNNDDGNKDEFIRFEIPKDKDFSAKEEGINLKPIEMKYEDDSVLNPFKNKEISNLKNSLFNFEYFY